MIDSSKQLEYIRNQLAWIKSKVELDNQLGLYDINKLGEDIFMHILNDVYDLNLKNANLIEENFLAIDLVDDENKIVIQVTSTTTPKKLRTTIEKFKKLTQYSDYQLKIFYIKEKPNFNKATRKEFELAGITSDDILGIDDIINIIQAKPQKCEILYKTIQQRMDAISFKFNIESYFEQVEQHLQNITSDKVKQYEIPFLEFIKSDKKVLDIYAVGGNGKSHLLRYLGLIETEYIPLIFTKQINIEEDLKKLDPTKKYLFIVDDVDRFLDQPILLNLLTYTLERENIKLILSYRTPSKSAVQAIYRKFNSVDNQEIEIIWSEDEIKTLITNLAPTLEEHKILQLTHAFNKNPYLITQAISGNIKSIKEFSKKIIDDTKVALKDFNLTDKEISNLLFNLSLLTPIPKNYINEKIKEQIIKLVDSGILRELSSKYRFNPDILGDLYLANYIDENKNTFEKIVENNLKDFSDTVFTNLSYALVYNESDSLQNFIKRIIQRWIDKKEYKNEYLALINKVVYFAPMESFIYLQNATKSLTPKKTNTIGQDNSLMQHLAYTVAPPNGDWSSDTDAINLESIEPIISKLIYALKNNIDCESITIELIINYLTSVEVLSLPKPYYDNQTIESIFEKIVSPLNTTNFDAIKDALNIMDTWIDESPINKEKNFLLQKTLSNLLSALYDNSFTEGITFTFSQTPLNLQHKDILEIINISKNIVLKMTESNDEYILNTVLDIISNVGGYRLQDLDENYIKFYSEIKKELLVKIVKNIDLNSSFLLKEKLENILIKILKFPLYEPLTKEALTILEKIERNDEYVFYLLVRGVDFLIVDFDKFKLEYEKNHDNRAFWFDSQTKRRHYNEFTEDEKNIIKRLSENYKNIDKFEQLMDKLDMSTWNAPQTLSSLLNIWYGNNPEIFSSIKDTYVNDIKNQIIKNAIKEILLLKNLLTIQVEDISESISNDDLRVYIDVIFKDFDDSKLAILNKIIEVLENKKADDIRMFISIISQKLYFSIADKHSLYYKFEKIIFKFLQWQLKYKFSIESYLTHHILYDIAIKNGINIDDNIIEVLKETIGNNGILIDEFELEPIYKICSYGLNEVVENIYSKLTAMDDSRKPKYIFTHYFGSYKISEVLLLKEFIHNYEDFKFLVKKVLEYYKTPIKFIGADGNEHEAFINLDYFFKYTVTKEYLEELFDELHNNNKIEEIKLLYKIVPVNSDYLEIIVKNLNLLENKVEEEELINYLNQVGKIKMFSSGFMENSDMILSEEKLFTEIMNNVDSLSLQLKLKDHLKYIELQKRREIEEDISLLLDK